MAANDRCILQVSVNRITIQVNSDILAGRHSQGNITFSRRHLFIEGDYLTILGMVNLRLQFFPRGLIPHCCIYRIFFECYLFADFDDTGLIVVDIPSLERTAIQVKAAVRCAEWRAVAGCHRCHFAGRVFMAAFKCDRDRYDQQHFILTILVNTVCRIVTDKAGRVASALIHLCGVDRGSCFRFDLR